MERILINATQQDDVRVALVEGQTLYDLNIERPGAGPKKGDIFKAVITDIGISLEVVFVEFAENRQGFLPFANIAPEYLAGRLPEDFSRQDIADHLKKGQELLVQVVKEERGLKERMGKKLAALTTYISLASPYLVLMPNKRGAGGISRRVEGDTRTEAKELRSSLELPEGMGLIIRTAGVDKNQEELQWDLAILLNYWQAIQTAYRETTAPSLIYQESDIIIRTLRDYLRKNITEIVIDNQDIYNKVLNYVKSIAIDFAPRIKLYEDSVPLFTRFQIESQIESAFRREVRLPSGGIIIIDQAEALTAIDINSAGSKRRKFSSSSENSGEGHFQRIEETAFNTNMEAAREIARQLRLRDIGGLVVIDFIDMKSRQNQREVENCLREALKMDKARTNIGRISQFGLLEMQRQRLRPSLGDVNQISCPRCQGQGMIRNIESLSSLILHLIEENGLKEKTGEIQVQVPVPVATYLLNERRKHLTTLEQRYKIRVLIIANPHLDTPQYRIDRFKADEMSDENESSKSYLLVSKPEEEFLPRSGAAALEAPSPVVKGLDLANNTPARARKGLIGKLLSNLFGSAKSPEQPKILVEPTSTARHPQARYDANKRPAVRRPHNRRPRTRRNNWPAQGQTPHSSQIQNEGNVNPTNPAISQDEVKTHESSNPTTTANHAANPRTPRIRQVPPQPLNEINDRPEQRVENVPTPVAEDAIETIVQAETQSPAVTEPKARSGRPQNNRRRHHLRGNKGRPRTSENNQRNDVTEEAAVSAPVESAKVKSEAEEG